MEKKFKFSDKGVASKLLYASVIAILCITAIVIGVVSASSRSNNNGDITNPPSNSTEENPPVENPPTDEDNKDDANKPLCFVSPVVGTVTREHSLDMPVFSPTLGEWRVHAGIDISSEDGANVYASEGGVISAIYSDAMLGYTVEITHKDDIKTRYSNLKLDESSSLKVGDTVKSGDIIGTVGDTSISELADEPHLHFEVLLKDAKVNPLDYISEESKESSLGIKDENEN